LLFASAFHRLGESWRPGIDRFTSGPLVTDGIYRWTRHPIYMAFGLLIVGTFLVVGRLIFLGLVLLWIPLLHGSILREERFPTRLYDGAYRNCCRQVRRYFLW
jgi:protein-S-isoprenylcysteine O-methyltransferase Ste14